MMKGVSKVDNELSNFVVNMLGCVTTKEPMILVLEFMECGNLLDYLRVTRKKVKVGSFCCRKIQRQSTVSIETHRIS